MEKGLTTIGGSMVLIPIKTCILVPTSKGVFGMNGPIDLKNPFGW